MSGELSGTTVYENIAEQVGEQMMFNVPIGKDALDYIISCLEIARGLERDGDSRKQDSPFPEIGPVCIYNSLGADPTVEFMPDGWKSIYVHNFLEFSGYVSAAIIKKRYLGELRTVQEFKEGARSYSLDFKMSHFPSYLFEMNKSGVVIHSEEGAYILQDAWNSIKKDIDKNIQSGLKDI